MVRLKTVIAILASGAALLGFLPLAPHLELLPRLMVPLSTLVGIAADRRGLSLRGLLPTGVSLAATAYYLIQVNRTNLVGPAVNLLAVLLAVRLACEKTPRTYLQIFALAIFTLAGASLFDLNLAFLGYLLALLTVITFALVLLAFVSQEDEPVLPLLPFRQLSGVALLLLVGTLPLMVVFFFCLPRTQFPLWNFLNRAGGTSTGISDTVQPGQASAVTESTAAVFRAELPPQPVNLLYWRAVVLNGFAGSAWVRLPLPPGERPVTPGGSPVRQTIYPEPGKTPFLPTLNLPGQLSGTRATMAADLTFTTSLARTGRVRYEMVSFPSEIFKVNGPLDRIFYTRLPKTVPPRLSSIGLNIARQGRTDRDKLALAEQFMLGQRLTYATSQLPVGPDALDDFLFSSKRGHCELFASAFALLMRVAGVPARLVGGFYGGSYSEVGGYYLVSEDRAHVWVEVYLQDRGWLTIDPSRFTANFAALREQQEWTFGQRLLLALDLLNYAWDRAVITYDLEQQVQTFARVGAGLGSLSLSGPTGRTLAVIVGLLLAVAALLLLSRRWPSPEERLLARFWRLLASRHGVTRRSATGLVEAIAGLEDPCLHQFVQLYGAAVYQDRRLTRAELHALRALLRQSARQKNRLP